MLLYLSAEESFDQGEIQQFNITKKKMVGCVNITLVIRNRLRMMRGEEGFI